MQTPYRKLIRVAAALALTVSGCTGAPRPATPTTLPPTAAPVVIATATATVLPTPIPSAPEVTPSIPAPMRRPLYVTGTDGQGLTLRTEPSATAERIGLLPDGTELFPSGEEQHAGGRLWRQVRDKEGRDGWAAAEFLTETSSLVAAAPTSAPAESPVPDPEARGTATPTWPVPLIPTATLAPPPTARPPTSAPISSPMPPVSSPRPVAPEGPGQPAPPAAKPAPPAGLLAPSAGQFAAGTDCHPSYPDFCVPPPPPDLNCSSPEVGGRNGFRIVGPDVHRLDQGGQPGIACDAVQR